MKNNTKSKGYPCLLILLFFIATIYNSHAQKNDLVTTKIDSLLTLVDEQIKKEKFEESQIIVDSLITTPHYKNNKFDKLAVDLRIAEILYGKNECSKAAHLILKGSHELANYKDSKIWCLYNLKLATIFRKSMLFETAFSYSNKALKNALFRNDTIAILTCYKEKLSIFHNIVEPLSYEDPIAIMAEDSMEIYAKKIVEFPFNNKTRSFIAGAYNSLANTAVGKKNVILAKKYSQKYIEIEQQLKDTVGLSVGHITYGNSFYIDHKYNKAIEQYKKSINLISQISSNKSLSIQESALQNISWSHNELKEYKLAYEYQEKTTDLTDSLSTIKHLRNIGAIEAKYIETQKTEIEKNKRLKSQFFSFTLILITLVIIGFFYIVYKKFKNRQLKNENKIMGLKFKALNAQMNPHFINNLLTAIHDLINRNEKKDAIKNLNKFNKLTNLVLQSTKNNLITLQDEVSMLELYLDLQLLRYEGKFNYFINTNELSTKDFTAIRIPPMILQPIVENSIIHGFSNSQNKGEINIDFNFKSDDYLVCTISDNATTSQKIIKSKMFNGSGISINNINQRLLLIDTEKNDKELISFSKMKNKINQIIGSKTELKIPLIYNI